MFKDKLLLFFNQFGKSFNPKKYHDLVHEFSVKDAIKYLAQCLVLLFLVMVIISAVKVYDLPDYVATEMQAFSEISFDVNQSMNKPFRLTENYPILVIDTSGETQELEGRMLVTDEALKYNLGFGEEELMLEDYKDVMAQKDNVGRLVFMIFLVMVPGLLILGYLSFFLKYLVVGAVLALLAYVVSWLMQKTVNLWQAYKVALFSCTLMAVLEIILLPFNLEFYDVGLFYFVTIGLLPLLVWVILFIMALGETGKKELKENVRFS